MTGSQMPVVRLACPAEARLSGRRLVGEVGLEPTKAKPADLQSAPFAARDIPPLAVEPHGISGKLPAFRLAAERPRAGVMVTPPVTVNRQRPAGVPTARA